MAAPVKVKLKGKIRELPRAEARNVVGGVSAWAQAWFNCMVGLQNARNALPEKSNPYIWLISWPESGGGGNFDRG